MEIFLFFCTEERHPLKDIIYEDSITTKRELIMQKKKKQYMEFKYSK